MKKFIKMLAMMLAVSMMLSLTAFAADPSIEDKTAEGEDTKVVGVLENEKKKSFETITYTDPKIVAGGQYMIFVTKDGAAPTASNLLYINQVEAETDGEITFENVYPKAMVSAVIKISGTGFDDLQYIADIIARLMGDVTRDGQVNSADAMLLLQHVAGLADMDLEQKEIGNVTGDILNSADAMLLLQVVAGLTSLS